MQLKKNTAIIDANVIIRYLLKDNKEMYEITESFFKEVFANKKVAYVYCTPFVKTFFMP